MGEGGLYAVAEDPLEREHEPRAEGEQREEDATHAKSLGAASDASKHARAGVVPT